MKYSPIIMVLITSLAIQSISYGIEDTGKDTTSIIFGVAKKINDSIIVHYETTKKTDVSDLKIVEAKLLEHTEFINKKKVSLDLATLIAFCAEAF